ncbi:unnamed protein product [Ilex paraguariensis]|uniref:Protein kinase domain-containing protein n=1 Tax=Ilex paraguariensis TaxID=185542 RepID=A0ABC8V217_9AQUA
MAAEVSLAPLPSFLKWVAQHRVITMNYKPVMFAFKLGNTDEEWRVKLYERHAGMGSELWLKKFNSLTSLIYEIGLNIQEAHAFSTVDGNFLDVFAVDGGHMRYLLTVLEGCELMDENEVVQVVDFGVARVEAQTRDMTAETGTY